MPKTDLKKEQRDLYAPPHGRFAEVVVPAMNFLVIDGHGDPNTSEDYRHAVEALFAVSYAAKFISKRELDHDYVVLPLEGLWSTPDLTGGAVADKSQWSWTMMLRQPGWVEPIMIDEALRTAEKKRLAAVSQIRAEVLEEGRSVQTLHVGSYDTEGPVIRELHRSYLPAHGLTPTGLHHEIYLSDPRRTEPQKLKVVLRQPVVPCP